MGQRIKCGITSYFNWKAACQVGIDDGNVWQKNFVNQRHLSVSFLVFDNGKWCDFGTGSGSCWNCYQLSLLSFWKLDDSMSEIEEIDRQFLDVQIREIVKQTNHLGGVEHRTATQRDDRVRLAQLHC